MKKRGSFARFFFDRVVLQHPGLRDLGIPIGNQSVLLKGVNDDTNVMRDLVHGLGRMGVKPYYLYYTDLVT